MRKPLIPCLISALLLASCGPIMNAQRRQERKNKSDNIISDIKNTKWLTIGKDKKIRGVNVHIKQTATSTERQIKRLEDVYFKRCLKWVNKKVALQNYKLLLVGEEDKEIYARGMYSIGGALGAYFVYKVRIGVKRGIVGIAVFDWKYYYPHTKHVRPFEEDSNYTYYYRATKSVVRNILEDWESAVIYAP